MDELLVGDGENRIPGVDQIHFGFAASGPHDVGPRGRGWCIPIGLIGRDRGNVPILWSRTWKTCLTHSLKVTIQRIGTLPRSRPIRPIGIHQPLPRGPTSWGPEADRKSVV